MKYLAILLAAAAAAFAAVDGTVINQTSGQPVAGADITVLKLTQSGPEQMANGKSDANGHFSFNLTFEPGPHLIEVLHDGITYNTLLTPARPSTGVQLNVYDASKNPGAAHVAQHIVFLEPTAQQLGVSETYLLDNNGKVTYNDNDAGTLRFLVPAAAVKDSLKVNATEPGGLPLEQSPEDTRRKGVYKLAFPIKPGETRIDVNYALPPSDPATFSSEVFFKGAPTRLVVPNGVSLQGDGVKALGQEPDTQANIYETNAATFQVTVQGTGTLRSSQNAGPPPGGGAGAADSDDSGPALRVILPPGFEDRRIPILGLALAALALGFVLLYRKGQAPPAKGKSGA
jgi:hypothetical protein